MNVFSIKFLVKHPHDAKFTVASGRFLVRLRPLKIFLGEIMKLDWVRLLANVQIFVLNNLGLSLRYDLLCILPSRSDALPDPLTLESEIDIPVIAPLIDCHSTHLLSLFSFE